jgi:two-component system C4-dicarboxylate transport sensor histidine kinase DctB
MSAVRDRDTLGRAGVDDGPTDASLPSLEARRLSELGLHAAGLVHELRQPLFAIKAMAQMALAAPGREVETLTRLLDQVATMETLLGGYHDFSRSPTGGPQVFDVWASVRSAQVILGHRATAAGVSLVIEDGPPMPVRGSMLGTQQAIVNLGQNAIDAVRGREAPRVSIRCEHLPGRVRVVVEDNGPGVPPEIRAHLFQPFRTTKEGGTGLGLSISRDLIVACGGTLRLSDTPHARWEIELEGLG